MGMHESKVKMFDDSDRRIRRNPVPLYQQVIDEILRLIDEDGLQGGDPLPSESELSQMFGVGRSTVREALSYLESERIIIRRRGAVTIVAAAVRQPALGLETLEPFEELAAHQGWKCGTIDTAVTAMAADAQHASKLMIPQGDPITLIRRTKTRNDEPIAVMDSFVPEAFMRNSAIQRDFVDSITVLVSSRARVTYAVAEVSLVMCEPEIAERLGVESGSPLLTLEELFWTGDSAPVSWNVNYIVPGKMRLELLRKRPRALI
jgi:GntR family transcriptional regulator